MDFVAFLVALAVGYLCGAIPFAVVIARSRGVNIFKEGSGNPGATNIRRVMGARAGALCLALDAAKGAFGVFIPRVLFADHDQVDLLAITGLVAAVMGHSFSVFIRFRGGKGVATTSGGLLALTPPVFLVGAFVWFASFFGTRVVSIASILAAVSLPISAVVLKRGVPEIAFTVFIALLIVVRHRSNIRNLLAGTENGFAKK